MSYTGIDISGWQAGISQFVINQPDVLICKATESTSFVSSELVTQFNMGVAADKKVGVYHFARPGDAVAQANFFVNSVHGRQLYPDFWVLDFEDSSQVSDTAWAMTFMNKVKELTGQPVWFYCYMAPMKLYGHHAIRNAGYKHWIAGYPYGLQYGFGPQMSLDAYIVWSGLNSSGIDFAGWQYTSQGRLSGWAGDLDFNMFFDDAFDDLNGSTKDWFDMATQDDLKAAVREVLNEQFDRVNVGGKSSIKAEAEWNAANFKTVNDKLDNIARMVWLIQDTIRIGMSGIVTSGSFGPQIAKLLGVTNGSDDSVHKNRAERYRKAQKNNWAWWV